MKKLLHSSLFFSGFLLFHSIAFSQNPGDTEFRKSWILFLKLDNGVISNFQSEPDLFTGGLLINPQVTVIENKLRIGINGGFAYNNKKMNGLIGPSAAFKIKTIDLKNIGGLANLQLVAEHSWGSHRQRLFGGGIGLEVLQKILLLFTAHRDYKLKNWWIQAHIGINLKKNKSKTPEFNR